MTALSPEGACAILESHGADPARWPAADRAALLALADRDAGVAAALAQARMIDALLAGWIEAPVPIAGVDVAAITALPQLPAMQPGKPMAWRPAVLAASLALLLVMGGWLGSAGQYAGQNGPVSPNEIATALPPSAGAGAGDADLAFAYVFTPTAAEEDLI